MDDDDLIEHLIVGAVMYDAFLANDEPSRTPKFEPRRALTPQRYNPLPPMQPEAQVPEPPPTPHPPPVPRTDFTMEWITAWVMIVLIVVFALKVL